jgi:hypothetical protein
MRLSMKSGIFLDSVIAPSESEKEDMAAAQGHVIITVH